MSYQRRKPAGGIDLPAFVKMANELGGPPKPVPPPFRGMPAAEPPMQLPPAYALPAAAGEAAGAGALGAAGLGGLMGAGMLYPNTMGDEWPQGQPKRTFKKRSGPTPSAPEASPTPPPPESGEVTPGAAPKRFRKQGADPRLENPDWVNDNLMPQSAPAAPVGEDPRVEERLKLYRQMRQPQSVPAQPGFDPSELGPVPGPGWDRPAPPDAQDPNALPGHMLDPNGPGFRAIYGQPQPIPPSPAPSALPGGDDLEQRVEQRMKLYRRR